MEDRPYWNMEMEPLLNTPEMREIQQKRLKPQLKKIYERSAIQKKYIDGLGVNVDKINTFEDLQHAFPADGQARDAAARDVEHGRGGDRGPVE